MFYEGVEQVSAADRHGFLLSGYLVRRRFLTRDGLRRIQDSLSSEVEQRLKAPKLDSALERDGDTKVLAHLDKYNEFFYDLARVAVFKKLSQVLLAKCTIPLFVEYFDKAPRTGSITPPHQDQAYYRFPDAIAIAFWIALDDAFVRNGCMLYAKSLQTYVLPHRASDAIGFRLSIDDLSIGDLVPVELAAGGCVMHHSFAIHASGPNLTNVHRRAVVVNHKSYEAVRPSGS